jgi:AraC family transcriptional regulator of arabinose operon
LLPGRREYFTFAADCGTHHTWIAVPPRLLDSSLCVTLDTAAHCLALSAAMQRCVEAGCAVAAVDNPEEFTVLAAVGRAALMLYAEEARAAAAARTREHPAMAVVRRHAREGAREGLGVADLARAVHLSPEHLIRLCRRDLKTTPGALLRSERLSHAMQLLAHTGLPVSEIAHRSGFASQQHFARSVRAATGLSPSGFRRLSWQAQDERLC